MTASYWRGWFDDLVLSEALPSTTGFFLGGVGSNG